MVINVIEDPEERACREAFEYYDWNKSGTIPFSVKIMYSSCPYIFGSNRSPKCQDAVRESVCAAHSSSNEL